LPRKEWGCPSIHQFTSSIDFCQFFKGHSIQEGQVNNKLIIWLQLFIFSGYFIDDILQEVVFSSAKTT
jgi:hypothetical protein